MTSIICPAWNDKASIWYGVDPLAEKYTNVGGYTYCLGNPIKLVDTDGKRPKPSEAARMAAHIYGDNLPHVDGNMHFLLPKDWSSVYNGHSMDNILKCYGISNPQQYNKEANK